MDELCNEEDAMKESFEVPPLKRQRSDVHPTLLANWGPKHQIEPEIILDTDNYDGLNDNSTFSEYAWAFLRRNRFYQMLVDSPENAYAVSLWGHKPNDEPDDETEAPVGRGRISRDITVHKKFHCGLVKIKPYSEAYTEGVPVEWRGIHTFYKELSSYPRTATRPQPQWPEVSRIGEMAFVFDVDYLHGPETNAIDIQLKIARELMIEEANKIGCPPQVSNNPPSRQELRAMLHVTDLLSLEEKRGKQETNKPAEVGNKLEKEQDTDQKKAESRLKRVASKLLPQDVWRNGNEKENDSNQTRYKRASELVTAAYQAIYEWKLLTWLQFDDWSQHIGRVQENTKT